MPAWAEGSWLAMDADPDELRAKRREHIDAREEIAAELRQQQTDNMAKASASSQLHAGGAGYETLLDVAAMTLGYALEHPDCPDYHRALLERLRGELDGMYGAVIANKGLAPADAPTAPSRPLFGPWNDDSRS